MERTSSKGRGGPDRKRLARKVLVSVARLLDVSAIGAASTGSLGLTVALGVGAETARMIAEICRDDSDS